MSEPIPIVLSWSGGKDCLLMLRRLQADPRYRIAGLLTTVWQDEACVAMHGIPIALIHAQATALSYDLYLVNVPRFPSNERYEAALRPVMKSLGFAGITTVAFGDLFLADIRRYREALCEKLGIMPIFPLWGMPTHQLAQDFIAAGYRARVCCTDHRLGCDALGAEYDAVFIENLPTGIDPCGENGEFHTFVTDGPGFTRPVSASIIGTTSADGFWWAQWTETDQEDNNRPHPRVAVVLGEEQR